MTTRDLKARHLGAVPDEGESVNNHIARENYERTQRVVRDNLDEIHDLSACKRLLRKQIVRAQDCTAIARAGALESALESVEVALRAR